jgi:pyridoxal phosphate enzyme (YggS family)
MIKENLFKVLESIKQGNNLGEPINLVGASKTMSVEVINEAISSGLKIVAENKVQEFREKNSLLLPLAEQHFIGHLQTNKVKYLVGKVALIHSVDSIRLAEEIDKEANKKGVTQKILIEVNVGAELSKSGFAFDEVYQAVQEIKNLKSVEIKGLMAMLPLSSDRDYLATLCGKMRALYDDLKNEGLPFEYLSIGTSGDYEIAINNGSNTIRLGRNIFGERNYGGK